MDVSIVGDTLGGIIGWVVIGAFALVVVGVIAYLNYAGVLVQRKYKCYVWVTKANGAVEVVMAKGRYVGTDKFEIYYSPSDKQMIEAPSEDMIYSNNVIHFVRESRTAHFPGKKLKVEAKEEVVNELKVNRNMITIDPSWSNASKLALINELQRNKDRFGDNPWLKYAPFMALVVGFLIVGVAWYLSTGQISEELGRVATQFGRVAEALKEAEIIIETPPADGPPPG